MIFSRLPHWRLLNIPSWVQNFCPILPEKRVVPSLPKLNLSFPVDGEKIDRIQLWPTSRRIWMYQICLLKKIMNNTGFVNDPLDQPHTQPAVNFVWLWKVMTYVRAYRWTDNMCEYSDQYRQCVGRHRCSTNYTYITKKHCLPKVSMIVRKVTDTRRLLIQLTEVARPEHKDRDQVG